MVSVAAAGAAFLPISNSCDRSSGSAKAKAISVSVREATCDADLLAACRLRVRIFSNVRTAFRLQEHYEFLVKEEFAALKERVEGKRPAFGIVTCVIATVLTSDIPCADRESMSYLNIQRTIDRVTEEGFLVGSLDLNQTVKLPDELCGSLPKD